MLQSRTRVIKKSFKRLRLGRTKVYLVRIADRLTVNVHQILTGLNTYIMN